MPCAVLTRTFILTPFHTVNLEDTTITMVCVDPIVATTSLSANKYFFMTTTAGDKEAVKDGAASPPRPPIQKHSQLTSSPREAINKKFHRAARQPLPSPSSGPASLQTTTASSNIIPLPKSHIHRTPSELQLADDMRRAEYDDVRMYARLVVGMQSQIQRHCLVNGGVVNPLSQKSLQGVLKTKQANDEELMMMHDHRHHHSGWGVDCIDEQDEHSLEGMTSSSSQGGGAGQAIDASTKSYLTSSCDDDDQDADGCVFNIEL